MSEITSGPQAKITHTGHQILGEQRVPFPAQCTEEASSNVMDLSLDSDYGNSSFPFLASSTLLLALCCPLRPNEGGM